MVDEQLDRLESFRVFIKAAEEGAEASRVAAVIDQQVQLTTEAHSATLAAISTAVGAEPQESPSQAEPSMGKRRNRGG